MEDLKMLIYIIINFAQCWNVRTLPASCNRNNHQWLLSVWALFCVVDYSPLCPALFVCCLHISSSTCVLCHFPVIVFTWSLFTPPPPFAQCAFIPTCSLMLPFFLLLPLDFFLFDWSVVLIIIYLLPLSLLLYNKTLTLSGSAPWICCAWVKRKPSHKYFWHIL